MSAPAADRSEPAEPALRVRRLAGSPVVSVRVLLRGGSRAEAIPGEALVTGRMLAEGSVRRDWRRIAEEAEALGADLSSTAGADAIGVAVDALARDWRRALDWAAEVALEPAFREERNRWVARHAAAELAALDDLPEVRTEWAFRDQLYRPHPAGRPPQGDRASLARLSPDDCRRFHRSSLTAGTVVAVAGEIDEEAVSARLEGLFAAAREPAAPQPRPPAPAGGERRREVATGESADRAHLFVGRLGVDLTHPGHEARRLLAVALGAGPGLGGRLPRRLRERDGLAYAVHVEGNAGAGLDAGRFEVYVATAPETAERALAAIVEELQRAAAGGFAESEIAEARTYLLGREPFRRQTARQWAELLAAAELYGLPLERPDWLAERLAAVDAAALASASAEVFDPAALRVTIGLPGAC